MQGCQYDTRTAPPEDAARYTQEIHNTRVSISTGLIRDNLDMPWFKIDDSWHSHPKVREAGNAAAGLWVRIGSYCSQYATEGFIRGEVVRDFGTKREIERLIVVGLLARVEGGFQIPDFLEYNPTAESVKKQRKATAERQRRWREQRVSDPQGQESNAVTNSVSHGVSNATPSRPVPTRPVYLVTSPSLSSSTCTPTRDDEEGFFEAVLREVITKRVEQASPRDADAYFVTVNSDVRRNHADALRLVIANYEHQTPTEVAAHYQARPELHPQAIA